jgi:hypothetical protein
MSAKGFTIPTYFTAVDKMTAPMRSMQAKINSAAGSMTKQFFGFASAVAIGAAAVSAAHFSVDSLVQYEKAVASFRTIVSDLTDQEFAKYQDGIIAVAKDTKN